MTRGTSLPLLATVLGISLLGSCRSFDLDNRASYPRDGLLVYYPFDAEKGRTVIDRSRNGRDATLYGTAQWTRGVLGGAILFSGTIDSYAADEDGGSTFNGLTAVSLAAWVKSNEIQSDAGFFICEPPVGHDRALSLRYDRDGATSGSANGVKGGVTVNDGMQLSFETVSGLQTSTWQHLVMTWESGVGFQLYADGAAVELTANAMETGELTGMTTLFIGKGGKDAGSSWNGAVDELFVYGRVLTPEEVMSLYERGLP